MHIFRKITCPSCKSFLHALALIFGYFAFLSLSGYIFVVIEEPDDLKRKDDTRAKFLATLDKYNMSYNNTMLQEIVQTAVDAYEANGLDLTDYTSEVPSEWHLGSAVFFAGTLVTTIGYGNISPKTTWGKVFTIIIALLGIPFTGIILGKLGLALSDLIKKADNFIEDRMKQFFPNASNNENNKKKLRAIQLTFVLCLFVILFLLIPAAAFIETEEGWEYFDSFYFCFISLTTIGLGDITPGASNKVLKIKEGISMSLLTSGLNQISVMAYLLLGLAALTIILTLIGSMIRSAAEKTLDIGGKAFKDVGGLQLVTETRKFASSIRKKTANTLGIRGSNSSLATPETSVITEPKLTEDAAGKEGEEVFVVTEFTKVEDRGRKNSKADRGDMVISNTGHTEEVNINEAKQDIKNRHGRASRTSSMCSQDILRSSQENVAFIRANYGHSNMPTAEG